MIDLYYFPTPNTWKVSIMLEECGLDYRVIPIDIGKGEQFDPEFLRICPNNRVPAIVDHDLTGPAGQALSLFESGAILVYLAEKTGRFLPTEPFARARVMQWLMFQMGGIGPMSGQVFHFGHYAAEKLPYAIERFTNELTRLWGVLDDQLDGEDWIANNEYSIADMSIWGWITLAVPLGQNLDDFPNLKRWFERMGQRNAVQRGYQLQAETALTPGVIPDEAKRVLYAQKRADLPHRKQH